MRSLTVTILTSSLLAFGGCGKTDLPTPVTAPPAAPAEAPSAATAPTEAPTVVDDAAAAPSEAAPDAAEAPSAAGADPDASVADATAGPAPTGLPDLGFRADKNGFKFENYINDGVVNLTAAELRRFFGDAACAAVIDGLCELTPAAASWMDETNKGMNGGHCEGIAVATLLMFQKKLDPAAFGGALASDLAKDGNERLQREIAYWFATQALEPTISAEVKDLTPKQIAERMADAFKTGSESYTLGIYKPEFKDGHAMTPYAVEDRGDGKVAVMVYDNNYPDVAREVQIDTGADTWTYSASTNPDEPESVYAGNADTKTLTITPMSARFAPQSCPFCGEVGADGVLKGSIKGAAGTPSCEIHVTGDAALLVTDGEGRRLGEVAGKLVSEIPGGRRVPMKSGSLWKDDEGPIYRLPTGTPLTVTLDGTSLHAASSADVTLIAPAWTLAVDDVMVDPGQKDTITFSAGLDAITYRTQGAETPVISLGVSTVAADWSFFVKAAGDADGYEVALDLDIAKGELLVTVKGAGEGATYAIEIVRLDDKGEQTFTHVGTADVDGGVVHIGYGTWTGQGDGIAFGVDKTGDGSIDETVDQADDDSASIDPDDQRP